jgi:hypothetical protein
MTKTQVTSLCSAIIIVVLLVSSQASAQESNPVFSEERDQDQPCAVYLAPSNIGGWGVFAARDFELNEVVEVAPRYLPTKLQYMRATVLDDYGYSLHFDSDPEDIFFNAVFGMTMFFNHGPGIKHNVQYTGFGGDPNKDVPWGSLLVGFVAKREIKRGEELLSSYGDEKWFTDRGLSMVENDNQADALPSLEQMEQREHQYCQKTIAGVGHPTWFQRVLPTCDHYGSNRPDIRPYDMLPLQDHPTTIAKEAVQVGQILEMAPALIVPYDQIVASPLAPMTIFWHDLDDEHHEVITNLYQLGAFRLKAISNKTGKREPNVLINFDDAAILPAAGNIGMVRKVGQEEGADSNCCIEIVAAAKSIENMDVGSSGLVLKLIATKDIEPGEELRLNLPDNSSWHSKMNLAQHLALTGQPIPKHLLDDDIPTMIPEPPDDVEQEL